VTEEASAQAAVERVREALEASIRVKQELLATSAPAIAEIGCAVADTFVRGGKILLFGNGGSASDAQHVAAEWVGRFLHERRPLPAIALSANSSEVTAIANDYGFERVFARGVEAHGRPGDLAFALSTSGNSPNVVAAVDTAQQRGLRTVALTGKGGGQLAGLVDWVIRVPSDETPRIQESHIAICHAICEVVDHVLSREDRGELPPEEETRGRTAT
jgi:D-sedoheptulose 7-phosphate isomerase